MKGNISKEMAQAFRNPEIRQQVMHIVRGKGRGRVRIGEKIVEIYRAGTRSAETRPQR